MKLDTEAPRRRDWTCWLLTRSLTVQIITMVSCYMALVSWLGLQQRPTARQVTAKGHL